MNIQRIGVISLLGLAMTTPLARATTASAGADDIRRDAVVNAVQEVMPSVVNIRTATVVQYSDFYQPLFREFYGKPRETLNSIGSGVIIGEDGWVLTNWHVLKRATRVEVKLWNGKVYEADPVVATEHSDVALIKLKLDKGEKLKAIQFAKDDDLLLGETVLALGNPFGLGATVTRGILSSKNRRPPNDNLPLTYRDWLQTDAAINPGNSGGPLIDLRGELIGLNVAVYREGQGIGFAIPIKQVSEALSQFFTPEVKSRLWFGARVKEQDGVLRIVSVQDDSPAAQAGLQADQEIVSVNGKVPRGVIQFEELLCAPENHVSTLVVRDAGKRQTARVAMVPFDKLIWDRLGMSVVESGPNAKARYRVPDRPSVYIASVDPDGPAARAGIVAGQILVGVENQEARNILTVATSVSDAKPGDTLRLTVVEPRRIGGAWIQYLESTVPVKLR